METATAESAVGARPVSRTQARPKRPRVQLDFTPEAYERIKELTVMAHAESIPDMFRDALRIYEWYQVRKQEGYKLLLQKDEQTTVVDLGL